MPILRSDQINESHLDACKKICSTYAKHLKKDIHVSFEDPVDDLARKKLRIINQAIYCFTDPRLITPAEKIKACQEILTKDTNIDVLSLRRDSWLIEASKQVSTLFLINIYRMLMGQKVTKGNELIKDVSTVVQTDMKSQLNTIRNADLVEQNSQTPEAPRSILKKT